ncbi:hypothetical protein HGP28_17325 [Vibrio sp. SM6]|uniref:SnoaL-like domain-containing protein n=1 Tax=Vibrio agarilyticus TaxID=2726741 RepID=A0A7X8TUN1_9VIBR|nr:hypothetical protein [Vibrio agarilyticus]NLS14623.1 hypothetical protein [Vibrio agarilyticus]
MQLSNKEKVVALLKGLETGDKSAIEYINPNKYIQHRLNVADGYAGFEKLMSDLPQGSTKVNVKRVFEDGPYVFAHMDYDFFGPKVGFDIFKIENGLIVEHWDNLTEKASSPNPSGRTQIDGTTEIVDRDKTEENKALVSNFVKNILIGEHYDKITDYINPGSSHYLQHNPVIADGIDGLKTALEKMAEQGLKMSYSKNHKILGEGNFVLSISEGNFCGDHVAYYDMLRIENNKIVEHWGAIETIPPESEWKNSNGKFGFN